MSANMVMAALDMTFEFNWIKEKVDNIKYNVTTAITP